MQASPQFWDLQEFSVGSPVHVAVVLALVAGGAAVVAVGRRARQLGPEAARRVDRAWAAALAGLWVAVVAYNLLPSRRKLDRALPIHVCHVVGLAGAVAAATRSRTARATVYFCGLGICSQAVITPALAVGPAHADFWVFWVWHGAIMTAAAYELAARRYRPRWRDWRLATAVTLTYAPVVATIDWCLATNYGWLGRGGPTSWSLMSLLGAWPGRMPLLVGMACFNMALIALPWPRNWPRLSRRGLPMPQPTAAFAVAGRLGAPVRSAA
jgi:hypothetical integral membrane protein (TIGR02206 family)